MATSSLPNGPEAEPVHIRISPTVAKDYELRGVFPDLRPAHAVRKLHPGYLYSVDRPKAAMILDDAVEQSSQRRTRELTLAYNRLSKRIRTRCGWWPSRLTPKEIDELSQILDARSSGRGRGTVTLLPTAAAAPIKQRKLQTKSYGVIDARAVFLARMKEIDNLKRAGNLSSRITDADDARLELRDMILDLLHQVDEIRKAAGIKWN